MFDFFRKFAKKRDAESSLSKVNLDMYFLDDPQRYVRFKHACIGDYPWRGEEATLAGCTCGDFHKTGLPCRHMYKVALDVGVYDELFRGQEDLIARLESLSPTAFAKFGERLYNGYFEGKNNISDFGRYGKQIAQAGLISLDGDTYTIVRDVISNLYFVIYYIMSDERFKKYRNRG